MFAKPQITVANKMDALDDPDRLKRLEAHLKRKKLPLLKISGATGDGVTALLEAMWKAIAAGRTAHGGVRPRGRVADRPTSDAAPAAARPSSPHGSSPGDDARAEAQGEGIDLLTPARSRRRGA